MPLTDADLLAYVDDDDRVAKSVTETVAVGGDELRTFAPPKASPASTPDEVFAMNKDLVLQRIGPSSRIEVRYGDIVEDFTELKPPPGVVPDSKVGTLSVTPAFDFAVHGERCIRSMPARPGPPTGPNEVDCVIRYYLNADTGELLFIWEEPLLPG